MANSIELITTYSPKYWDVVYKQEAVTSVLDANPKMVKFEGTKTVKIAKWQNGGLQNYYRNNLGDPRAATGDGNFVGASDFGYQKSAARLTWEEFTLRCDRGAAFEIEYFDDEESGGEIVGTGVTEISRVSIVPEVDAYALSTIASYCTENLGNLVEEDVAAKPLEALNRAFTYFANKEVPAADQVAFVSPKFINALRQTNEVTKFLGQTDFSADKDVKFEITKYQGRDLITVSPERLRTNIELVATGYEGGYRWGEGSKEINFLMVAKSAVIHVVKYQKVRIISGEANLAARGFDGYTIFARIYHDVFVPDNKRVALYCSVAADGDRAPTMKLDVLVENGKVKSITTVPGDKLAYVVTSTAETEDKITYDNSTIVRVGDKVESGTKFYAVVFQADKKAKPLANYTYTAA